MATALSLAAGMVSTFQQTLNAALISAGTVLGANTPAVQSDLAAAQNAVNALLDSTDPLTMAFAFNASQNLQQIAAMLASTSSSTPLMLFGVINPDLVTLASQIYKDAFQWELIAAANGFLTASPIGTFNLTIPPLAAST